MLQTEVLTVSEIQLLMCSCCTEQTGAGENSISDFSAVCFINAWGKRRFSVCSNKSFLKERSTNNCSTSDINNIA